MLAMFPVASRTVCSAVGGERLSRALSEWDGDPDRSLEVDVIEPKELTNEESSELGGDCLVVDSDATPVDVDDVIGRWVDERPESPVVLLVDGWDADRTADALAAGVTETLPRALVDSDPDLLAERIAATVERETARSTLRELYDSLAGVIILHDPESGEIVHANRTFCDLLGYDREHVLSMRMGDFLADVPGYDHDRMTNVVALSVAVGLGGSVLARHGRYRAWLASALALPILLTILVAILLYPTVYPPTGLLVREAVVSPLALNLVTVLGFPVLLLVLWYFKFLYGVFSGPIEGEGYEG
jgi:PAS domain-containing protein